MRQVVHTSPLRAAVMKQALLHLYGKTLRKRLSFTVGWWGDQRVRMQFAGIQPALSMDSPQESVLGQALSVPEAYSSDFYG